MKNHDEFDWPQNAQTAFETYPQIEPSRDFNRRVIESLQLEQAKRSQTFRGRLEEFLGVDVWKFVASGALGGLLPMLIIGVLYFAGGNSVSTPSKATRMPLGIPDVGSLYARELWRDEEFSSSISPSPMKKPSGGEISCLDSKFPLV